MDGTTGVCHVPDVDRHLSFVLCDVSDVDAVIRVIESAPTVDGVPGGGEPGVHLGGVRMVAGFIRRWGRGCTWRPNSPAPPGPGWPGAGWSGW